MLEIVGVGLGLLNQWLTIRQNIWCWPVGIASVSLLAVVFLGEQLFSDTLLQAIYIVLQCYGWWRWSSAKTVEQTLPLQVTRLCKRDAFVAASLVILGTLALGTLMATLAKASFPFVDASASVLSVTAQWLQARKVLESWLIFIIANIIFMGVYWSKGLYPTLALFTVMTAMAVYGFMQWRKATINQSNNQALGQ